MALNIEEDGGASAATSFQPSAPELASGDYLLNEVEVARLLRCSPRTLQTNRRLGRGCACVKVGRLVRYRFGDVQAWIASRTIQNLPPEPDAA